MPDETDKILGNENANLTRASQSMGGGRVMKVVQIDSEGQAVQAFPSKQIEDPFSALTQYGDQVVIPPYPMDQLTLLAEAHPIHSAALEQKTRDVVANGLQLVAVDESGNADEEQKQEILDWWESLFDDFTSVEVLNSIWDDFETTGWGLLEVARDVSGKVRRLYHVPAHTVRAHRTKTRFVQEVLGDFAWFKAWGVERDILLNSGRVAPPNTKLENRGNEMLVFRRPSRRSQWYGIPAYVSAIGHLSMAVAARDFNIQFFDNYREPRHLIIVTGLAQEVEEAMGQLDEIWKGQLQNNPHRNIVLPIEGSANVTVHKLGLPINDMHFTALMEQTDAQILVSHRMPSDRLGIAKRGFLGGTVAQVINQIYKDAVVSSAQVILESRIQKFIEKEFAIFKGAKVEFQWKVNFEELDISDEQVDISNTVALVNANLITLNEGRERLGQEKHEPFGEMTLGEYLASIATPAAPTGDFQFLRSIAESAGTRIDPSLHEEVMSKLGSIDELLEMALMDRPEALETAATNGAVSANNSS